MLLSILPVLVVVFLALLTVVLLLAMGLGLGWLLTLFLPFSLFEGALLGMLAMWGSGAIWFVILRSTPPIDVDEDMVDEGIPEGRFWEVEAERTWANWFRYVLANAIYGEIMMTPGWLGGLRAKRQQEIAIELADASLAAVRVRVTKARAAKVTCNTIKQQLLDGGQRPYEDEVLDVAVRAVNLSLLYMEEELRMVIKEKLWDEFADVY